MMKVLTALGPTASGKTSFAVALARACGGEIVGADSRQVYRGMDIGTGKDISEYSSYGEPVPYHLIDIVEPSFEYNLAEYVKDASAAIEDIAARGATPVLTGGSALYLDSLMKGYELKGGPPDKSLRDELRGLDSGQLAERLESIEPGAKAAKLEGRNRSRLIRQIEMRSTSGRTPRSPGVALDAEFLTLGVLRDRKELHERIERRLDSRLSEGMVEEVARLHGEGLSWERLDFFGLEYRYVAMHLQGEFSLQEMRDRLLAKIRQFAKRQDSWFRKMEREGLDIYWFRPEELPKAIELSRRFLNGEPLPKPSFRLMSIHYGRQSNP